MRIVLVGAGEVGSYLAQVLSDAGHAVTLVERDPTVAQPLDEALDIRVVVGEGSRAGLLKQAGVRDCDGFLAMTSDDATNLVACSLAQALGARQVISRIHDQTLLDHAHLNYPLHFGIDAMLNPEALCAQELAKVIRNPARISVEAFARGQVEAQRLRVAAGASWEGRALKELKLPSNVRVGFVEHGDRHDVPQAETVLQVGDYVTVFGPPAELGKLRGKLDPEAAGATASVVILGGGEIGVSLLRLLNNPRFRVRLIEQNPVRARELAEQFPQITVLAGDGSSLRLMEEEQVGGADVFVGATGSDERNVMTAVQAHQLGAKQVHAVVNKSDYEAILHNLQGTLGIATLVSPRVVTAQEVMRYLSKEPFLELPGFSDQAARILEFPISDDAPAAGKTLRACGWPRGAVAVALMHKFQTTVPGAEDRLLGGDRVVCITREENIPALRALLHPS